MEQKDPQKLRTQYERVYLTTPALLPITLERIYDDEHYIETGAPDAHRLKELKPGGIEVYPKRYEQS